MRSAIGRSQKKHLEPRRGLFHHSVLGFLKRADAEKGKPHVLSQRDKGISAMNMQSHTDEQVIPGEPFTHKDYPPGTWVSIDEAP